MLDAHFPYIVQRWDEGCHSVRELWRELVRRGLRGSYQSLINYLHRRHEPHHGTAPSAPVGAQSLAPVRQVKIQGLSRRPSPRQTAWMILKPEDLGEEQREMVDRLCAASAEVSRAKGLALSFLEMERERQAERLDGWMSEVGGSGIAERESFADNLAQDRAGGGGGLEVRVEQWACRGARQWSQAREASDVRAGEA